MAVSRALPSGGDIRIFELDRGIDNRFTSRPASYPYPLWSPDGERLVFSFGNPPKMFAQSLSGGDEEVRVTRSAKSTFELANDWSPDGRYIMYFEALPDTSEDLWYVAVSPDKGIATAAPQPWLRTPAHEFNGRFSPEMEAAGQRWVAYQSDESGRFEIYADLFPKPGHKIRVSPGGGQFPEWGPPTNRNGRELFYVSLDYRLMAVTLQFGPESLTPSAPRELFSLPATVSAWTPFQATPDGQRFLVRGAPEHMAPSPLRVVVNWSKLGTNTAAMR
jgi:Tol biopolymer transport system component